MRPYTLRNPDRPVPTVPDYDHPPFFAEVFNFVDFFFLLLYASTFVFCQVILYVSIVRRRMLDTTPYHNYIQLIGFIELGDLLLNYLGTARTLSQRNNLRN